MPPTGTFTSNDIRTLVEGGYVHSDAGITSDQIQPSSLDLCISAEAYRMPGSVLALAGERVRDLIDAMALEAINLSAGTCLARGNVYLVRLRERLKLPEGVEAYTNSKSSTGRIDLATRVITDGNPRYDRIHAGYHGEIWLELIPRSFDIIARSGDSLNQAIFFTDRHVLSQQELAARHRDTPLLFDSSGSAVSAQACLHDGHVVMSANLSGAVVGYVAKRSHRPLTLSRLGSHRPDDFFTPIDTPRSGYLFLEKDRFYILASSERVVVPPDLACEMVPYDPASGEFRAHYAGFFDPGWGIIDGEHRGNCAVLEVRPHEDDLILRHGQPICAMAYENLSAACSELYGSRGNNYARQDGPRLSKHFHEA